MDIFDIVGPIMVGPSSSHTAGAVRIGYIGGKLLGEPVKKAKILLYGSFLATGEGHGTKKAIVAGLLGKHPARVSLWHPERHMEGYKQLTRHSYITAQAAIKEM